MFFSVVVDNVFELGVNLLVNLHFCVQGLHSSRFQCGVHRMANI